MVNSHRVTKTVYAVDTDCKVEEVVSLALRLHIRDNSNMNLMSRADVLFLKGFLAKNKDLDLERIYLVSNYILECLSAFGQYSNTNMKKALNLVDFRSINTEVQDLARLYINISVQTMLIDSSRYRAQAFIVIREHRATNNLINILWRKRELFQTPYIYIDLFEFIVNNQEDIFE